MIRTLFKLAIFLVIALLGYNYFFGTPTEKEQSRRIVAKAGDLGKEAWNLLRSERDKFREGKYDGALERLDTLYGDLRERARQLENSDALDRLEDLSRRRRDLEHELEGKEAPRPEIRRELDELTEDTEELMHEMEEKGRAPAPY